jgi:DnaA family protein
VFELRLLDDDDKESALRALAGLRGVALAPDVLPWLLRHRSRDIRVLLAEFDAIDRYALERKRPITLALVREWLARGRAPDPFGASPRD